MSTEKMKKIAFFEHPLPATPITKLSGQMAGNTVYVKRDDLLPFAFGGNKVRKAAEFYHCLCEANADIIMTYGSETSNHCRVIALMASAMGIGCHVITPDEGPFGMSFNERMIRASGAVIERAPLSDIPAAIAHRETAYRQQGKRPYFIKGGGHGLPGTLSYVKTYAEILRQEEILGVSFDRIYLASGTGCTQAGLVIGEMIAAETSGKRKRTSRITGISIARQNPQGRDVIKEAVLAFMEQCPELHFPKITEKNLLFTDAYTGGGYGKTNAEMNALIRDVFLSEGLPLDPVYTGKAFYGMTKHLEENGIRKKKILFLHTGGTPIFFDHGKEHL